MDYRIVKITCSLKDCYFKVVLTYRSSGQDFLKAKINLLLKKVVCLGRDYPP